VSNQTPVGPQPSREVSRREAALKLLSGLAAGTLFPSLSPLHPVRALLLNDALLDSADKVLASATQKPLFLSAAQFSTLETIAEAIVPGSRKARSAAFIDLLLSVDSEKSRQEFAASLGVFNAAAEELFQRNIVGLSDAQVNELLQTAAAKDSANYVHFESLKGWAIGAYYSSEIGMGELGWTPDRVFAAYPGCSHTESHS
jgi:gluconate 2-dehydrogenase subunit 3-like protein